MHLKLKFKAKKFENIFIIIIIIIFPTCENNAPKITFG